MTDLYQIALDTLKAGAPGLSDQTKEVLAGIIARKASLSSARTSEPEARGAWPEELTPEMEQVWRSAFISQGHLRRNQAGRVKHPDSCEKAAYRALRKFVSKAHPSPDETADKLRVAVEALRGARAERNGSGALRYSLPSSTYDLILATLSPKAAEGGE